MKRLVVDSSGSVVVQSSFFNQTLVKPPTSPLGRLDSVLNGGAPNIVFRRTVGGIGDVLMTLPTIKAIKKKYKANIDYATDPDYLNGALVKVIANNPYIDNIVDHRTLDNTQYSLSVNLTCPCTAHEVPKAEPINRIDLFARSTGLAIPLEDPSIDYIVTEKEKLWADTWLNQRGLSNKILIVVQANSSTRSRDMPQIILQAGFVKLINSFNGRAKGIVILHTDNKSNDINWKTEGVELLLNHGVREIAAIVDRANLVICPDSAILHLASALNKKTVALFGPTDPRARVNYHKEAIAIWFGMEFACGVCWWNHTCRGTYPCWKRIEDNMIVNIGSALIRELEIEYKPYMYHFGDYIKGMSLKINTLVNSKNSPFEVL